MHLKLPARRVVSANATTSVGFVNHAFTNPTGMTRVSTDASRPTANVPLTANSLLDALAAQHPKRPADEPTHQPKPGGRGR